jgi:hypothetical protein
MMNLKELKANKNNVHLKIFKPIYHDKLIILCIFNILVSYL